MSRRTPPLTRASLSSRSQTAYVSAGQAGAEIAVNGAESNPIVLGLGVVATLAAISYAGNVATEALKDLDVDLSAE